MSNLTPLSAVWLPIVAQYRGANGRYAKVMELPNFKGHRAKFYEPSDDNDNTLIEVGGGHFPVFSGESAEDAADIYDTLINAGNACYEFCGSPPEYTPTDIADSRNPAILWAVSTPRNRDITGETEFITPAYSYANATCIAVDQTNKTANFIARNPQARIAHPKNFDSRVIRWPGPPEDHAALVRKNRIDSSLSCVQAHFLNDGTNKTATNAADTRFALYTLLTYLPGRPPLETLIPELAMMLRMCAYRLQVNGHADLADNVTTLLKKHSLTGWPLRGEEIAAHEVKA